MIKKKMSNPMDAPPFTAEKAKETLTSWEEEGAIWSGAG